MVRQESPSYTNHSVESAVGANGTEADADAGNTVHAVKAPKRKEADFVIALRRVKIVLHVHVWTRKFALFVPNESAWNSACTRAEPTLTLCRLMDFEDFVWRYPPTCRSQHREFAAITHGLKCVPLIFLGNGSFLSLRRYRCVR